MKVKLVALNARFSHSCLALFCIRQELEKHCPDFEVSLFQYTINDPYYELLLRLGEGEPDYIFLSALIWNSDLIEKLVADIRTAYPDIHLVIGGPQVEVIRAQVGGERCSFMIGEIEAVPKDFYSDLQEGRLQTNYTGRFLKAGVKQLRLAYRDEDFEEQLKNRHVYYESSRGCPFSCTYCLSSAEKGIFHKPVEEVCEDIDFLLNGDPMVIRFVDRTFNDNPDRALAIWKYLVSKNTKVLFHFEVAPDRFTEEILDFLATVPDQLFQFEIGIQSTNPKTLSAIKRFVDSTVAHNIIQRLSAPENIHIHLDLILGLPFETEQTFGQSFRDVFAMGSHYIQMGLLKILPDTQICHSSEEYGYTASSSPPYSIFSSKWMDRKQLTELYWFSECVEKFLNNRYFPSLWKYLRTTDEDIYLFFRKILSNCLKREFFKFAATHELMGEILLDFFRTRADYPLVRELIQYDWLRCGHRFFPVFLSDKEKDDTNRHSELQAIKKELFHTTPEAVEGLFSRNNKSKFFKKSLFLPFSAAGLTALGFVREGNGEGIVCFMHERETRIHSLCKTVLISSK